MQLRVWSGTLRRALLATAFAGSLFCLAAGEARADDRFDFTTTWFQEQRRGGQGGLTVIHPQVDLGVDIGERATVDVGYSADVVTGATAAVYSTDAVSTATPFDDIRHEGSLGLGFKGRRSSFGISGGVATERDYASMLVSLSGAIDLPGKNTNLGLAYTHNFDHVCDKENALLTVLERQPLTGLDACDKQYGIIGQDNPMAETVWRDLSIDTLQATLTQNLSPVSVLQVSLFGQVLHGFQANPYRRVRIGDIEPQESIPDVRARAALSARLNFYIKPARGAAHLSARVYSDTWGVKSATGEVGYSQYMGKSLLFRFRTRVYQQTAATFFKDAFYYQTESTAGAYFTGDRELAPVRNVLVGGKLSFISVGESGREIWGFLDRLQLNLKADVLLLDELPSGDLATNFDGIDDQFLHAGQLLDAVVIQLGLLASY